MDKRNCLPKRVEKGRRRRKRGAGVWIERGMKKIENNAKNRKCGLFEIGENAESGRETYCFLTELLPNL